MLPAEPEAAELSASTNPDPLTDLRRFTDDLQLGRHKKRKRIGVSHLCFLCFFVATRLNDFRTNATSRRRRRYRSELSGDSSLPRKSRHRTRSLANRQVHAPAYHLESRH